MRHLISQPHIIFSVENSPYPDKVQVPFAHEEAIQFLKQNVSGGKVHSLDGHYGKPEKSILITDPSDEQKEAARTLTYLTGQDSHIESDGYTHKMIYNHGPNSGKVVMGRGTTFHESKPKDMYSVLPDGTVFTHNFDFENSHVIIQKNSVLEKAKEEEWMSPEAKRSFRSERKKFSPQDPLASQLTSDRGVSETGIEARRADSRILGARAHGYARVSSPEFHAKRAKTYARETLEDLRSQPKPNLPKSEKSKPKFKPLMKPYVSEAQRRWAHTPAGMKALGGKKAVEHWGKESKGKDLPEKIEKALSPEELQAQGYKFRYYGRNPIYHVIQVFKDRKKVGHLAYTKNPVSNSFSKDFGYHRVELGRIEPEHQGKGLYQNMLNMAKDHVKSLGSKGIMSEGYQRSKAATRAWDKVATHADPYTSNASVKGRLSPEDSDYYLAASEIKKSWDKNSGLAFINQHMPQIKQHGFGKMTIIGSVANKGFSNKDLDVHIESDEDESDFEALANHFESHGYSVDPEAIYEHPKTGDQEGIFSLYHPEKDHYIDLFFGKLQKPKTTAFKKINKGTVRRSVPKMEEGLRLRALNNLSKGLKGDWKKEGYTLKFHSPKVEMFNGNHDMTYHRVTAHDSKGNMVGDYYFSEWPEASEHRGLLHVTFSSTDPDHQRKGLASAAYSVIEQKTGKKLHSSVGNRSADAKKLWAQPNRQFGKSLQKASLPSAPKVNINPEHGKKIADAYHNMKHDPNHPEVKAAYGALIDETKKQYKDLLDEGFKFTKVSDPSKYPYKNSKEMHHDIEHNKHLYYLPTQNDTFGSDGAASKDHPLLQPVEFTDHEGKPMLANDLLRQVHDINGHFKGGKTTFGPKGEHEAYIHHKKMYSEKAQPALANELLMQNSWVNFGPYGEHNRKNPANTIYAPQKVGLVPEWVWKGKWHGET